MATLQPNCCRFDVRMNKEPAAKHFENAVSKFEERRGNMVQRQQFLKNKITTMERSIPALMAYNMWVSGQKCADAPLCKVKEIMATFSPTPDPTDKLIEDLKNTVTALNAETEKLHGKIIDADIELEESGMELESLEAANSELTKRVADLEHEVERTTVPSLHSIHSEDLVCLSKIRKLGQEEVSLKCCIRELEEKEVNFRQQMEKLLTSREFQKDSGGKKMVKKIQELEATERKMNCALQTHKHNMHQLKKKLMQKEKDIAKMETFLGVKDESKSLRNNHSGKKGDKENSNHKDSWLPQWMVPGCSTAPVSSNSSKDRADALPCAATAPTDLEGKLKRCVCPTPAPIPCYEKPPCRSNAPKSRACFPQPLCVPPPCPPPRKPAPCPLPSCCKPPVCPPPSSCEPSFCFTTRCAPLPCKPTVCPPPTACCKNNSLCKVPECLESSTTRRPDPSCASPSTCPYAYCGQTPSCPPTSACVPAPCDTGSLCHTCQSPTPCKECLPIPEPGGCRCSCKGKCSRGESSVPCNCSVTPKCSADKGYQPKGLPPPPCGGSTGCWLEEDSDENFCDCCDCGCNDSDESIV